MGRAGTLPYLPGLDGLRALAVIAVVLFHAGQEWLPGGFLGVEVFFVISGYIITSGLLAEWRETGRIGITDFWLRRARRLLPAVFALLAALAGGAALVAPRELPQLREYGLAAIGYATNWKLILGHQDYFASFGRPPLLQHLWSLAVEEQFYIVWPLVLAAMLRVLPPKLTALVLVAGAAGSAGLMAFLYDDLYDTARIYYGTDTRASGLLLGAAMALAFAPALRPGRWLAALAAVAGAGGLAGLLALGLLVGQYEPMLYQGGFLLTGLATLAVIGAVLSERSVMSRLLGLGPLRWAGTRSYGIYLWHWPLLLVTAPAGERLWWELAGQIGLVLLVAEVSYRLVEMPIRRGLVSRLWASISGPRAGRWSYRQAMGAVTLATAAVALTVSVAAVNVTPANASRSGSHVTPPLLPLAGGYDEVVQFEETAVPLAPIPPAPEPEVSDSGAAEPAPPPPAPLPVLGTAPMPQGVRVTAIGDSVMLGASRQMAYVMGNVEVNADVARQTWVGLAILREYIEAKQLGDVLVVGFGSNGQFTAREFEQFMELARDLKLVVFVNVRVPRPWEEPNNRNIARGVAAHPNAVMVDWYAITEGHAELFSDDKVHLTGAGIRVYASLIADAIIANWRR